MTQHEKQEIRKEIGQLLNFSTNQNLRRDNHFRNNCIIAGVASLFLLLALGGWASYLLARQRPLNAPRPQHSGAIVTTAYPALCCKDDESVMVGLRAIADGSAVVLQALYSSGTCHSKNLPPFDVQIIRASDRNPLIVEVQPLGGEEPFWTNITRLANFQKNILPELAKIKAEGF